MAKVVGIDLGTTNSAVAVVEGGEPAIIPNAEGGRTMPSVVAWGKDGDLMVGQVAHRQAVTNARRTVFSIKRFMGRNFDDLTEDDRRLSYTLTGGSKGDVRVQIDDEAYTPQEISAHILRKLKQDAEAYLGEEVTRAVITVPAYFSDSQRQATKDAGRIAGLEVLRIINEPTAAALAYGRQLGKGEQTVLVFDLGGGTFDVSILSVDMDEKFIEVRATSGNNHLGGDDFDQRILDWMADDFQKNYGVDLRKDPVALQRLREAAEKAKIELSSVVSTNINLAYITVDQSGPRHLEATLTRARFEDMISDLVQETAKPIRQALSDAGMTAADVDRVILVGGSTRVPAVQAMIEKELGKEPFRGINPDEVVALGAAIQASVVAGEVTDDIVLADVTPLSLGVETLGGVTDVLIPRNTTIPTSRQKIYSTASDNQPGVEIHVLQGERPMAADNKTLGRFNLDGIPPAPRGVPRIEVTFDIDVNGIVSVKAKDLGTGREQKVTIQATTNLDESEIERLVKEAEEHAEEDRRKKEAIEVRNEADSLVFTSRRTVKDLGDKADEQLAKKVEEAAAAVEEALKGEDLEAIKTAKEELEKAVYELSAKAYQEAEQAAPDGGTAGEPAGGAEAEAGGGGEDVSAAYQVDGDDEKEAGS